LATYPVNPVILSKKVILSKDNKIRENPCNPRLLFMQNEPNFVRRRRIASAVMTGRYDNIISLPGQKTNPIRTQSNPKFVTAKHNEDGTNPIEPNFHPPQADFGLVKMNNPVNPVILSKKVIMSK
jgi:hypothetical protein